MQLRRARLCLDCEELHEDPQCPACASEAFVYLTRWIPVDDLRSRRRARPRSTTPPRVSHFVKGGAVGLAVLAAARWLMRAPSATDPSPAAAGDSDTETNEAATGSDGTE